MDKIHNKTIAGIEECQQAANLLSQTIRSVHEKACVQSPVVAMVLFEALVEACEMDRRLSQLLVVAKCE